MLTEIEAGDDSSRMPEVIGERLSRGFDYSRIRAAVERDLTKWKTSTNEPLA